MRRSSGDGDRASEGSGSTTSAGGVGSRVCSCRSSRSGGEIVAVYGDEESVDSRMACSDFSEAAQKLLGTRRLLPPIRERLQQESRAAE